MIYKNFFLKLYLTFWSLKSMSHDMFNSGLSVSHEGEGWVCAGRWRLSTFHHSYNYDVQTKLSSNIPLIYSSDGYLMMILAACSMFITCYLGNPALIIHNLDHGHCPAHSPHSRHLTTAHTAAEVTFLLDPATTSTMSNIIHIWNNIWHLTCLHWHYFGLLMLDTIMAANEFGLARLNVTDYLK